MGFRVFRRVHPWICKVLRVRGIGFGVVRLIAVGGSLSTWETLHIGGCGVTEFRGYRFPDMGG